MQGLVRGCLWRCQSDGLTREPNVRRGSNRSGWCGGRYGICGGGRIICWIPPLNQNPGQSVFCWHCTRVSATVAEVHPSSFASRFGDGGMVACAGAVLIAESSCVPTGAVPNTIPHGSSDGASSYRRADAKVIYLR